MGSPQPSRQWLYRHWLLRLVQTLGYLLHLDSTSLPALTDILVLVTQVQRLCCTLWYLAVCCIMHIQSNTKIHHGPKRWSVGQTKNWSRPKAIHCVVSSSAVFFVRCKSHTTPVFTIHSGCLSQQMPVLLGPLCACRSQHCQRNQDYYWPSCGHGFSPTSSINK